MGGSRSLGAFSIETTEGSGCGRTERERAREKDVKHPIHMFHQ